VLALLSHEMRTPLNGVLGMAGLLAATKLDATQQAYLSALRESGELLLGLVNDILDLAKLDSRPLELEPVDTDVERLLQGVCELLSPRAQSAGIEIAWSTVGVLPRLRADDGRLRQILFNLAGNAIKLTQTGGVLVTAAKAKAAPADGALRVRFSVKDTGPGVAAESQTRIFEAFEQTEAGARAGGAGLGLAIVKRLAAAFGGELGLTSPPGEGAEFWFEADFALAEVEAGQRQPNRSASRADADRNLRWSGGGGARLRPGWPSFIHDALVDGGGRRADRSRPSQPSNAAPGRRARHRPPGARGPRPHRGVSRRGLRRLSDQAAPPRLSGRAGVGGLGRARRGVSALRVGPGRGRAG
jgi:hypothetical protein